MFCRISFSGLTAKLKKNMRSVYTGHDHERDRERDHERERERGVRIGLRINNLYESVYTKGNYERGWKLVRAENPRIAFGANF